MSKVFCDGCGDELEVNVVKGVTRVLKCQGCMWLPPPGHVFVGDDEYTWLRGQAAALATAEAERGEERKESREVIAHLCWLVRRMASEIEARVPERHIVKRWVVDAREYAERTETRLVRREGL